VPTPAVLTSFALIAALLTITPGLDTAIVLRTAAMVGRRRATGVIVGVGTGVLMWGALAALGVSALLTASRLAYDGLRLAGAAYLVWMGVRMLAAAARPSALPSIAADVVPDRFRSGWRQGLLTNLLNPKVGVFYAALLPQFIPAGAPQLSWGLTLAAVHVTMGTVWLTLLMLLAGAASRWMRRPRVSRTIDALAGTAIAAFGVKLAASH
jgi:threonine/homoserine/homoserine lactone efflux protein